MKKFLMFVVLLPVLFFPAKALADSPIYTGLLWDTAPAVAYNSQDGEFLVVWNMYNYLYLPTDKGFFGPLMGQRMNESGEKIGQPFEISTAGGVLPDVAYNKAKNEYLVVTEQEFNTVGQRVSAQGANIGGPTLLLGYARYPRVLYNSLAGNYLVTGAWLTDTGSGNCDIRLYTIQVDGNGQPLGSSHLVTDKPHGLCEDGAIYAIAYAPIVSAKTPQGRYLLAIKTPVSLRMLDSDGNNLPTLYNPQQDTWNPGIPFQQSKVGVPYGIDVAYGQSHGNPVFFLVWGDISQHVDGYGEWTGIWAGIVDAEQEVYYTTAAVSNDVFPISFQYDHWAYKNYAKEWKPVVAYNPQANTFTVAWRETPGTDPRDMTNVNHIRANTSEGYRIPPHPNLVISSTGGSENPTLPCIASSSKTSSCLIAWEDHRNFFDTGDIYGSFFDAFHFPPCPECTGDPVVLINVTFPSGTACECSAATSITVGSGTVVKNGATVVFRSPSVKVKSGAKFEAGAVVSIKQQ